MFNIIPLIIILVCIGIILAIIAKKLPFLANFDISSIPHEKETEVKTKLMEERLQRKLKYWFSKISPALNDFSNKAKDQYAQTVTKLKALEDQYRTRVKKQVFTTKDEFENFENQIEHLLNDAANLAEEEKFEEAEKKYIEVISLEPKNIEAYRGLGSLYYQEKNLQEAEQTFFHILKLNKEDDLAYAKIAQISLDKADYEGMLFNIEKALQLQPNNPRYLDLLITASLKCQDKQRAMQALEHLQEVNPENQKIEEFAAQIAEL